jgi:Secretion system C-terminal sorting domain
MKQVKNRFRFLFTLLVCTGISSLYAQRHCVLPPPPPGVTCPEPAPGTIGNYVVKNIVTDFGADPTGATNSHQAFECAAYFFNANGGNGELFIPWGTYRVGSQQFVTYNGGPDNVCGFVGRKLMHLVRCNNLTIRGESKYFSGTPSLPVIIYEDSMRLGGFNAAGLPVISQVDSADSTIYIAATYYNNCNDWINADRFQATIGTTFLLESCNNVEINSLEINGNSNNYRFGAFQGIGPKPFELPGGYAIHILNSKNILLDHNYIHHSATDNILIQNRTLDSIPLSRDNITINNTICSYPGRNCISWVGGSGVVASNSEFSNAGRGKITTAPAIGLSIEAEAQSSYDVNCDIIPNSSSLDYCIDGYFTNCTFSDSREFQLGAWNTADSIGNFNFTNCTFKVRETIEKGSKHLITLKNTKCTFECCSFFGESYILDVNPGVIKINNPVLFKKCFFRDCISPGVPASKSTNFNYYALLNSDPIANNLTIDECLFVTHEQPTISIAGTCDTSFPPAMIKNSKFYNYNQNPAYNWYAHFILNGRIINSDFYQTPVSLAPWVYGCYNSVNTFSLTTLQRPYETCDSLPLVLPLCPPKDSVVPERIITKRFTETKAAITEGLRMVPNPANATVTIQVIPTLTENATLIISNSTGQEVERRTLAMGENKMLHIGVNHWPNGIYYVRLITRERQYVQKLLVGH